MNEEPAFDFLTEAQKTASPDFHSDKVTPALLYLAMGNAARALQHVDLMRKALFYGRDIAPDMLAIITEDLKPTELTPSADMAYPLLPPKLIHGILGAACEGGEKLELLMRSFDGVDFDHVNYLEEAGDGFWFDVVGLAAAGYTYQEAMETCIKKLEARSKGKKSFDAKDFNERDLLTERSVLEQSAMPDHRGDKVRVTKDTE